MSNCAKGRWLGVATVALVTVAWMCATTRHEASAMLAAGVVFGMPYGVLVGTLLGAIAGQLPRYRTCVVVALALASTMGIDALVAPDLSLFPGPSLATLRVLSCLPTLAAAVVLERWTRPALRVPEARDVSRA